MSYNTEARREAAARYRAKNRAAVNARSAEWRKMNGSKIDAVYYATHREQVCKRVSDYSHNNLDKVARIQAKYKAQKLQATPAWADSEKIASIYKEARKLVDASGNVYHVDHIIPLQGVNVCGLHVENNLQILPGSKNLSKGNRFESLME